MGVFCFAGVEYPYFFHPYNRTWANERAVELPIFQVLMSTVAPSSTLEVGNVLSHYVDSDHTVVDKWEHCEYRPILNCDLLSFDPEKRFDLIVSISTIEHVGWDESPKEEKSVILALQKLQSLLTPSGKAFVTIPVGYNQYLDQRLPDLINDQVVATCLKRISQDNHWVEVSLDDALKCKYGEPFAYANAVVLLCLSADQTSISDEAAAR